MEIKVHDRILEANIRIAERNRELFRRKGITVLNLIGGPGAGKTTLLEASIPLLLSRFKVGVIEGDIYTSRDSERILALGVPVVQINTKGACHLDGNMVESVLSDLPLDELDVILIENVGNLVCPAEFDVGEDAKIVVMSVTEGDDKPQKYPLIFHLAKALVITKSDMLKSAGINLDRLKSDALSVNPKLKTFLTSARKQEGLGGWADFVAGMTTRRT
ncbi:MAG: hydrogenase nickel incorporation protein HypB [Candidatus Coatesbacteria bacterium]|nr:hydrogenase nickel incorporation protein HypB [Candidatus Coatesbacteria bacterium]